MQRNQSKSIQQTGLINTMDNHFNGQVCRNFNAEYVLQSSSLGVLYRQGNPNANNS